MLSRTARHPPRPPQLAGAAALIVTAALGLGASNAAARGDDRARPRLLPQQRAGLAARDRLQSRTRPGPPSSPARARSAPAEPTARGRIRARFTAPLYKGTNGTKELSLSVTDGPNVASTSFLMSPLAASFSPQSGNPATLRVRWRILGMGAAQRRLRPLHPPEREAQEDAADRHHRRRLRRAQDRRDRALPVQVRVRPLDLPGRHRAQVRGHDQAARLDRLPGQKTCLEKKIETLRLGGATRRPAARRA